MQNGHWLLCRRRRENLGDYCDQCPCYDDGYGSGFWIPVEDVPAFKEAYKAAKKAVK